MSPGEGRRLCVDQPDGIPHLVDEPRAQRCDQHRAQRHRWSDANRYRRLNNLPLLPWQPQPLSPERRGEALRLFADHNAVQVYNTARNIQAASKRLRALRNEMSPKTQVGLDLGLASLDAMSGTLLDIAQTMGWPPAPLNSGR